MITDGKHDEIARAYREAIFPLLAFTIEELEEALAQIEDEQRYFREIGPILAPAAYFTERDNTQDFLWWDVQNKVARHLLEVRKTVQLLGPGAVLGLAKKVLDERAADEFSETE